MKPLILKFMAATGLFVGTGAVSPIPDAVMPARQTPIYEMKREVAVPKRLSRTNRSKPTPNLEARALAKTIDDAQAKLDRLLADFGEPEGVSLEEALARHPELQGRVIGLFAAPEVRVYTAAPDGTMTMTVKKI